MGLFLDAPVQPDDVTVFVREVPVPRRLTLLNLFPVRYVLDNRIDFMEIVKTNRTARYRSFDGRIHVSERDTGSEKFVNLAPLSSSLSKGEYERLQIEFAKTAGTNKQLLTRAVYNDAEQLTQEVQNRLNQAWGDVFVDGKLTINEDGFMSEADYGVPGGHIVTAATPWTTVASAPLIDNLTAWSDTYESTNGTRPEVARTSRRVLRLVTQNSQAIGQIVGTASGKTRVSLVDLNDYLASESLPTFDPNPIEDRVDVDGSNVRIVPDDRVFLTPSNENMGDLGSTVMGVSATALELVNSNDSEMSFAEAPGIVGMVVKEGPPFREFTYVDAVGQPVLNNAKLLFVADVA